MVGGGVTIAKPYSKTQQLARAGSGIGLRNNPKPARVIEADLWRAGLGPCAVCGVQSNVDAHHVIGKGVLHRYGLDEYRMDKRNRLAVCRRDHDAHHNRSHPIGRGLLPAAVFVFAEEVGLTWWLDRHYPARGAA